MNPRAYDVAQRLSSGRRVSISNGWYRLRGVCHGGESLPGSLAIRDFADGGIAVKCWKNCDRQRIMDALERTTGWKLGSPRNIVRESAPPPVRSVPPSNRVPRANHLRFWALRRRVPVDPSHPARQWAAARSLYWAQIPWPDSVQWLNASQIHPLHEGAGAVIAAFAPPQAWLRAWPLLPQPSAVELIHIDKDGAPALDRPESSGGRSKRTFGTRTGALCVLGEPRPEFSVGLILAEGIADALSLAARETDTVAAVGGTSGMATGDLDGYVGRFDRVKIVADSDKAGISAARAIRRRLGPQRVKAVTINGADDPADAAANEGIPDVEDLEPVREFTADLRGEGLPTWEAARQAIQLVK